MTARIIKFPVRYPPDADGVSLYRSGERWVLRHQSGGRCVEIRNLTLEELRDIHDQAAVALVAFGS